MIIIILVMFEDMTSKLEKIDPFFSSFNPFPSLRPAATDDRKPLQCRKIVFLRSFLCFALRIPTAHDFLRH